MAGRQFSHARNRLRHRRNDPGLSLDHGNDGRDRRRSGVGAQWCSDARFEHVHDSGLFSYDSHDDSADNNDDSADNNDDGISYDHDNNCAADHDHDDHTASDRSATDHTATDHDHVDHTAADHDDHDADDHDLGGTNRYNRCTDHYDDGARHADHYDDGAGYADRDDDGCGRLYWGSNWLYWRVRSDGVLTGFVSAPQHWGWGVHALAARPGHPAACLRRLARRRRAASDTT